MNSISIATRGYVANSIDLSRSMRGYYDSGEAVAAPAGASGLWVDPREEGDIIALVKAFLHMRLL